MSAIGGLEQALNDAADSGAASGSAVVSAAGLEQALNGANDSGADTTPPPPQTQPAPPIVVPRPAPPIGSHRYFSLHHVLLSWMSPLMALGASRTLQDADVPELAPADASAALCEQLGAAWEAERARARASRGAPPAWLGRALFHMFLPEYVRAIPLLVVGSAVRISQTQCLALLIEHVESPLPHTAGAGGGGNDRWAVGGAARGVLLGAGVVVLQFLYGCCHHAYVIRVHRCGMRIRSACTSLLFAKLLRVRASGLRTLTHGHVTNLASTDVERFQHLAIVGSWLLVSPVEAAVVAGFLWREVGAAAAAGVLAVGLLVPLQTCFSRLFASARRATARAADARVRVTGEVVAGAGQIKMSGWEAPFGATIGALRAQELVQVRRSSRLRATNQALFFVASAAVSCFTFLTYGVAMGRTLTRRRVFTSMALFNLLQFGMGLVFAKGMEALAESRVTLRRLQALLELPQLPLSQEQEQEQEQEQQQQQQQQQQQPGAASGDASGSSDSGDGKLALGAVEAVDLRCPWDHEEKGAAAAEAEATAEAAAAAAAAAAAPSRTEGYKPMVTPLAVNGLTFSIQPGTLFGIVGPVGCGKSALLLALLRELHPEEGEQQQQQQQQQQQLRSRGRIAYAAQEPFLLSDTLRANVIFTAPFDAARYAAACAACALGPDLAALPAGDATVIGERGINLSGGQRARVALARACYARPHIALLDDPLSAVDAPVARHLMEQAVCGGPLARCGATRVLVTHQEQFLGRCDAVLVLGREGKALCPPGPWKEVRGAAGAVLSKEEEEEGGGARGGAGGGAEAAGGAQAVAAGAVSTADSLAAGMRAQLAQQDRGSSGKGGGTQGGGDDDDDDEASGGSIVANERSEVGVVTRGIYGAWARAAGGAPVVGATLLLMLLGQTLLLLSSWWLGTWAAASPAEQEARRGYFAGGFGALVGAAFVVGFARSFAFFRCAVDASATLHGRMLAAVLAAPIAFFERNPMGRILNRFSSDVAKVDDLLPQTVFDFLQVLAATLLYSRRS